MSEKEFYKKQTETLSRLITKGEKIAFYKGIDLALQYTRNLLQEVKDGTNRN